MPVRESRYRITAIADGVVVIGDGTRNNIWANWFE
jgi:hypothetical protein